MLLAGWTEKWWVTVMDMGLDPELTKWSVRLGPAIVLTGKGYKEHHWLVVPSINHFSYTHSHHCYQMPSSFRTIPGTQDQYSRGRTAVCVRSQTGNRTNAGRAITPFMFNEECHRGRPLVGFPWSKPSTQTTMRLAIRLVPAGLKPSTGLLSLVGHLGVVSWSKG